MIVEKCCTKCGLVKSIDSFNKKSKSKDGYRSRCRECQLLDNREYRAEQRVKKELIRASLPVVVVTEKRCTRCGIVKSLDAYNKKSTSRDGHRSHCRECQSKSAEEYLSKSEVKIARTRYSKIWYTRTRPIRLQQNKTYRENNKEKTRLRHKRYREDNREKEQIRHRKYRHNNPLKKKEEVMRRRALVANATIVPLTIEQIRIIHITESCAYCGIFFSEDIKRHIDHIVPLSKGGSHTFENLISVCEKCNLSKGSSLIPEWYYCPTPHTPVVQYIISQSLGLKPGYEIVEEYHSRWAPQLSEQNNSDLIKIKSSYE